LGPGIPHVRRLDAIEEAVAIAALTQAIIVKLHRLYQGNMSWRLYRRALIEENKWRAARYGIDGKTHRLRKEAEVPMRQLIPELLELVDDVVDGPGQPQRGRIRAHDHERRHQRGPAVRVYQETGD